MKIKNNKKGFTMIELIIAVVLVGIIAAMAVPLFTSGYAPKFRLKEAGRNIVSSLRLARSMAVSQKTYYGINFDTVNRTYLLFKDKVSVGNATYDVGDSLITTSTLSPGLTISQCSFSNTTIVFGPDGSASGTGNILLTGSSVPFSLTVNVLASTGRVKLTET